MKNFRPYIRKEMTAAILLLVVFFSCKKKSVTDTPVSDRRIATISDGIFFNHRFTYDGQNRLSRIDYDAGSSLRFIYNSSGIVMHQYNGETPDPDRKFDLTIVNGVAVKGRQYLPGNKLNEYSYQYTTGQKMSGAQVFLKTGNILTEQHTYSFHYDAQGDLTEMLFSSTAGNTKTDSVAFSYTYYTNKTHLSWGDMGFSYFGSAAICADNLGYGTYMPQLFGVDPRPRTHAPASLTRKVFAWDAAMATWKPIGMPGTQNISEHSYEYNEENRLTGYGGLRITWQ